MNGVKSEIILLLIMSALELILTIRIYSKIKAERTYANKCIKLSAVVKSVSSEKISSKYTEYSLTVKAENNYTYDIRTRSHTAFFIHENSTVNILVPKGAYGRTEQDNYYEQIYKQGTKALNLLSEEEKKNLNEYLDQKLKNFPLHLQPTLTSDGTGTKKEIIPMCCIAIIIAIFIIADTAHICVPVNPYSANPFV